MLAFGNPVCTNSAYVIPCRCLNRSTASVAVAMRQRHVLVTSDCMHLNRCMLSDFRLIDAITRGWSTRQQRHSLQLKPSNSIKVLTMQTTPHDQTAKLSGHGSAQNPTHASCTTCDCIVCSLNLVQHLHMQVLLMQPFAVQHSSSTALFTS